MMRVRSANGATKVVHRDEAVEILDSDGKLGVLFLITGKDTVRALTPGDPLFTGYCKTHGMRPATVHKHSPFATSDQF